MRHSFLAACAWGLLAGLLLGSCLTPVRFTRMPSARHSAPSAFVP